MSYGNGIKLTAGFDVGAKTPLDSKSVVQTIAERDAFVTDNLVYEGLEVYVKDTGHKYRYNGTSWIDLDAQSGSESGTGEGLTTEQAQQLTTAYEHSQTPHVSADDIPTNISDLTNDSGFITSIPSEYVTETELNAKGYLTSHQDISGLQTKTDNNLTTTSKEVVGAINELDTNKIDKPTVNGTAGQILVLQDDGSLAYEDNVGSNTTDLTKINDRLSGLENKRVYNSLEELNTAKGLSISFTDGEDNTMKIVDVLSPIETFADYFNNSINTNRFGIDTNTYGTDIALLTITKLNDKVTTIRAYMSNGKLLIRRWVKGVLEQWQYDKTDFGNGIYTSTQQEFGKRNKMRLIAHRGFKSNQPENSYESLHDAAARGYWGVECDIQETSDGEYVIMHDSTVDRTTSGTGEVSSKTLAEIKALTLTGSLYGVPVFEEWLVITKTYGIVPVIEIKNLADPNKFVQILRDTGVIYNCIVISFEKTALEQVYNIDSKISVSYVVNPMTTDTIDEVVATFGEGNSICPYWGSCTEELVKYAFSKNIEVIPWTLNTIEDYSEALKMGLNCIETETFPTGDPLKNDISTGKINIFPNPIIEVEDKPFKLTFSRFVHSTNALESSGKLLPCWECRSAGGIKQGNLSGQSLLPEFVYNSLSRNGSYQIIKIPEGAERITTDLDLTTYKWTFQQFNIDGIVMQDIGWVTTKSANILDGAKYGYVYVNLIKEGKLTDGQLSTLNSATFNFTIKQKPTRKNYTGSQSVDVNLDNRCAFVISSQCGDVGCAYLLLSNYNAVCSVVKLGGSDKFTVTATHKSNSVDTITVSTLGDDYSWYIVYM